MRLFRVLAVILVASSMCVALAIQKKETFWERVFRVFGISATSSKQKGPDGLQVGEIWVADLVEKRNFLIKGTEAGDYRSPIFMACEQTVLALQGDKIIKTSIQGGTQQVLSQITGVVKLVGYSLDDKDKILFLRVYNNKQLSLGLFSLAGNKITDELQPDEGNKEEKTVKEQVAGSTRVYGDTTIFVETYVTKEKSGERSDVYLQRGTSTPINVSQCSGQCGQPSLSPEGRYVTYIRSQN